MRTKIVAIHQPNFLPWLGFFDKIMRSDVFVILDNVQFSKKGGTWTNRVRVLMNGQENWLTVPVVRNFHGTKLINEMLINDSFNWREKMIKSIRQNYVKATFFSETMPLVDNLINHSTENLAEYNIKAIYSLAKHIGLSTSHFVLGSSLDTTGSSNELLISITKRVGGGTYMSGGGASAYQDEQKFIDSGLGFCQQDFRHPLYNQLGRSEFVAGLSVIDALFNCGSGSILRMLGGDQES